MKRLHKALLMPWAGGDSSMAYTNKVIAVAPANLIQYLVQAEPIGATVALDSSGNARNGAYTAVTLGAAGIGDGRTAASFNGTTSLNNAFSASLQAAFNGSEGTMMIWLRYAGTVNDGVTRRIFQFLVDANNRCQFTKITDGRYGFTYAAGGTNKTIASGLLTASLTHWAMTWSASGDQMKAYVNGAQFGSTQTGLGVFAGSISATQTTIMAGSTGPIELTNGIAAHAAVWDTPLSAAQILTLATVP